MIESGALFELGFVRAMACMLNVAVSRAVIKRDECRMVKWIYDLGTKVQKTCETWCIFVL